jgi:hypothetical protein
MQPRDVLMLPMKENDAGAITVGGYLQALLRELWEKEEAFSGKRPFGNSGWTDELYFAVIAGGAVEGGELDGEGYVERTGNADQVISDAIDALFPEAFAVREANRIAALALIKAANEIGEFTDLSEFTA